MAVTKQEKLKTATKEVSEDFRPVTGATFVSIDGYRAKGTGEIARHVVNVMAIPYHNVLAKDIVRLDKIHDAVFPKYAEKFGAEVAQQAFEAVQESNRKSVVGTQLTNQMEAQRKAYAHADVPGMKFGIATGKIYIYGYAVSKVVIEAGEYKKVNSAMLTLAKNAWRSHMKSSRYRNFILENTATVKTGGKKIEVSI